MKSIEHFLKVRKQTVSVCHAGMGKRHLSVAEDWVPWRVRRLSGCAFALLYIALDGLFPIWLSLGPWYKSEVAVTIRAICSISARKEFRTVTDSLSLPRSHRKSVEATAVSPMGPPGQGAQPASDVAVGVLGHSVSVVCVLSRSFLPHSSAGKLSRV